MSLKLLASSFSRSCRVSNNIGLRFASYQPLGDAKSFPFSKQLLVPHIEPSSIPPKDAPLNTLGRFNHQLKYSSESSKFYPLFSRRGPIKSRIPPSSVITVTYYTNPEKTHTATFAGVLIGIRRRNNDVTIRLRNVIMKLGVEQIFSLGSGLVKDIQVLKRGKMHRSKIYWVRNQPKALQKMASGIQSRKK
ncbi:hypothetical protein E3Q22_00513 [Wallemia mellicola]|uniref:Uncharacterized protein n=2 Tax=Wallemia mellicola TaxID=1708541 RepID=A0A4T0NY71_9BASI|nr:hypothetical protein WALSEDRAFT_66546 [Wallemia mellicola CBS 633.66]TIB66709.1 hypothetical protein E3Q24_04384 [Wallemia mellicola]EIM19227.1 hypothetical protein WALSEDRAFT_66546 [Wallemia mellicola CBS 633.66]TIB78446.1 hypothetical protein E3Q21_04384 [Wallemia mellicola]TIB82195.1 hypothetical protein E3Q22_00513 [Wallemia mellicola]TIB82982.1 hypothetical protein E3Q20_04363 [Wallemia mellicola]|eukprot:XP_006960724.1 hypothetical protein WALSEDRAFT_66546 [Wallemia mellicola CBS 633.66]